MNVSTKWHDLRKDPNDLPQSMHCVWVKIVEPPLPNYNGSADDYTSYTTGYYWRDIDEWVDSDDDDCEAVGPVVAWCELPKLEEEKA